MVKRAHDTDTADGLKRMRISPGALETSLRGTYALVDNYAITYGGTGKTARPHHDCMIARVMFAPPFCSEEMPVALGFAATYVQRLSESSNRHVADLARSLIDADGFVRVTAAHCRDAIVLYCTSIMLAHKVTGSSYNHFFLSTALRSNGLRCDDIDFMEIEMKIAGTLEWRLGAVRALCHN